MITGPVGFSRSKTEPMARSRAAHLLSLTSGLWPLQTADATPHMFMTRKDGDGMEQDDTAQTLCSAVGSIVKFGT